MGHSRTFFLPVAVAFFLALICTHAWAGGKIQVVKYELKPVEAVDSGRYIKTEWSAKIRNRASEEVVFDVKIIFVDSSNEVIKEATTSCQLKAQETKTFTDTLLLEASIANRVASTRVALDETTD